MWSTHDRLIGSDSETAACFFLWSSAFKTLYCVMMVRILSIVLSKVNAIQLVYNDYIGYHFFVGTKLLL